MYLANRRKHFTGGIITGDFNTVELDTGKYVNIDDDAAMDVVNVTFGGWFNVDSAGAHEINYILVRRNGSTGPWTSRFIRSSGSILAGQSIGAPANFITYALPSPEDNWNFFLSSYDGTTNTLYVNGSVVGTNTDISGDLAASISRVRVGRQATTTGSTQDFQGNVGPMFMFDSAISTGEMDTVYNLGLGIEPEDLPPSIKDKFVFAIPLNDGVVDPYVDRSVNAINTSTAGSPSITTPTIEFG